MPAPLRNNGDHDEVDDIYHDHRVYHDDNDDHDIEGLFNTSIIMHDAQDENDYTWDDSALDTKSE